MVVAGHHFLWEVWRRGRGSTETADEGLRGSTLDAFRTVESQTAGWTGRVTRQFYHNVCRLIVTRDLSVISLVTSSY